MKVTLFMAVSLNGIIARPDGDEDFLSEENWNTFLILSTRAQSVIWGRKTQEEISKWEPEYLESLEKIVKVVVSTDKNYHLSDDFVVARSPKEAVEYLSEKGFEEVILSGGGKLNASFADEGLIDEIILNIDPVVVADGIPLFAKMKTDLKLEFLELTKMAGGITQLRFKVLKKK